jgi:DNA polymerase-1
VVFAPEPKLIELYERLNADVYRSTAAELLGVEEAKVTKEQRNKAKAIVLGISYGLSAFGLPTYAYAKFNVKITPDEATGLIEGVFEMYPNIEADHDEVLKELNARGYVDRMTLTGRRRDGIRVRNEAINAPIQGTGVDILKLAMAKLYRQLGDGFENAFIVGVFHDEILVECDEADAEDVRYVSENAMIEAADELLNNEEPRVPVKVDGGTSRVWTKD